MPIFRNVIVAALCISLCGVATAQTQATKSLYLRLGGYDAIAAVSDDFIGRLASDAKLSRFFVGLNDDSKLRVRQHVIDFLCNATGGPCAYLGQDMKTAHKGLAISESDWNTAVTDLTATFDKFKVAAPERTDLVAALGKLKPDIVTAK
jgi:hemoglobin